MQVSYRADGVIGVITLDRPPVNSFDVEMRRALLRAVRQARDDTGTIGVVIIGSLKAFSAGADIEELGAGRALDEPLLSAVLAEIEESAKPYVAAISGACLGAGLELALACHFRLAARNSILGFPEIKLGLLPGAGTQRLSRAIGVAPALQMMLSGQPVDAQQAEHLKLASLANEGDLLMQARALAQDAGLRGLLPRLRDVPATLPAGREAGEYFDAQVAALRSARPAQVKCVGAVRAAVELPFDEGVKRELALFRELLASDESKALRYGFFSERAATKVRSDARSEGIRSVAVLGSGTMGAAIAICCADAGLPVTLLDLQGAALDRAIAGIRAIYDQLVKKGKLSPARMEERLRRIRATTSYADIADVDLVIEAVFEEITVKEAVFRQLDKIMKPGAVLATNTSTLDVNRIAAFTSRPQDVVGLHFFSPANVMRLLEIVRARQTSDKVLATVQGFARKIGKIGVVAGVCDGFIGNRMLEEYFRQAYLLLEMGALPAQVDAALRRFGMAMGPFAVIDLAGGDIAHAIRTRRALEQPDRPYSKFPDRLYELGRFGQKTGAGFFRYEGGNRNALPAPDVDEMVVAYSAEIGVARRAISDQEIVQRCVLALVNEGARIVEEGIAARASDVDVVYLNGYGFPADRGGPMFHADSLGLEQVLVAMEGFRNGYMGHLWEPAPLLVRTAEAGLRLSDA